MSTDSPAAPDETDLTAADIAWDLSTLLDGRTSDELLDQADRIASSATDPAWRSLVLGVRAQGRFAALGSPDGATEALTEFGFTAIRQVCKLSRYTHATMRSLTIGLLIEITMEEIGVGVDRSKLRCVRTNLICAYRRSGTEHHSTGQSIWVAHHPVKNAHSTERWSKH